MSIYLSRDVQCCGLREIDGLGAYGAESERALFDLAQEMYGNITPAGTVPPVNPYKKPKGVKWSQDSFWGDKYWMDGDTRVYQWQAEDWEDSRNGYDEDGDGCDSRFRYAVFTQAGTRKVYGKKFAALIKKVDAGTVVQATTKTVKNPNSGNVLKAWLWTVNHKGLKTWAEKYAAKAKEKR